MPTKKQKKMAELLLVSSIHSPTVSLEVWPVWNPPNCLWGWNPIEGRPPPSITPLPEKSENASVIAWGSGGVGSNTVLEPDLCRDVSDLSIT